MQNVYAVNTAWKLFRLPIEINLGCGANQLLEGTIFMRNSQHARMTPHMQNAPE
jgi:hypothetical protein